MGGARAPDPGVAVRVAGLADRIAKEEDPTERTKLQRLLDAVTSIGRDVAVDVIGAALKRGL